MHGSGCLNRKVSTFKLQSLSLESYLSNSFLFVITKTFSLGRGSENNILEGKLFLDVQNITFTSFIQSM